MRVRLRGGGEAAPARRGRKRLRSRIMGKPVAPCGARDHSTDWGGMEAHPRESAACSAMQLFRPARVSSRNRLSGGTYGEFQFRDVQAGRRGDRRGRREDRPAGRRACTSRRKARRPTPTTAPRNMPGDAVARVQDGAAELDDMVSEQVGRHPKAMVALGVGIGFALGVLFASSRSPRAELARLRALVAARRPPRRHRRAGRARLRACRSDAAPPRRRGPWCRNRRRGNTSTS